MLIASMIIKVLPEKAEEIAWELRNIPALTCYGVHKENNIIVVAEAEKASDLEDLSRQIIIEFPDVLGVFPTYLTSDQEEVIKE